MSIIIVLIFIVYAKKAVKDIDENYNRNVISASTYSLYLKFNEKHNNLFDNTFFQHDKCESRGIQFRNHVIKAFEQFNKDENVKLARIDLVFENKTMINLLYERGCAISNHNIENICEAEDKIH